MLGQIIKDLEDRHGASQSKSNNLKKIRQMNFV
jgi:hypothetical protein